MEGLMKTLKAASATAEKKKAPVWTWSEIASLEASVDKCTARTLRVGQMLADGAGTGSTDGAVRWSEKISENGLEPSKRETFSRIFEG